MKQTLGSPLSGAGGKDSSVAVGNLLAVLEHVCVLVGVEHHQLQWIPKPPR